MPEEFKMTDQKNRTGKDYKANPIIGCLARRVGSRKRLILNDGYIDRITRMGASYIGHR